MMSDAPDGRRTVDRRSGMARMQEEQFIRLGGQRWVDALEEKQHRRAAAKGRRVPRRGAVMMMNNEDSRRRNAATLEDNRDDLSLQESKRLRTNQTLCRSPVMDRSGNERSGPSHQVLPQAGAVAVGAVTVIMNPLGRSHALARSDFEQVNEVNPFGCCLAKARSDLERSGDGRSGSSDLVIPQACPVNVVMNPLRRSLARASSDLERVNTMDPSPGRSLTAARSVLKSSESYVQKAFANVESNSPLVCSLAKARSDIARVEPINEDLCCICHDPMSKDGATITLPCCSNNMHNDCMFELLKNQGATPKCPLCRASYDSDMLANLVAKMTEPKKKNVEVVDLTKRSLSHRIPSLDLDECYAELDRLEVRQLSKRAKSMLKSRLWKRVTAINDLVGLSSL